MPMGNAKNVRYEDCVIKQTLDLTLKGLWGDKILRQTGLHQIPSRAELQE